MSGKKEKEFQKLVQKYLDGTATSEEQEALDRYYLLFRDEPENTSSLSDEQLFQLEQRLESSLFDRINPPAKVTRLWPRIAVAAAIAVVVFGAGLWFFGKSSKVEDPAQYAQDVAPGKNGATLTLADGRKILISDATVGNIASESGVKISKTEGGQIVYEVVDKDGAFGYNTLSTTRGEQTKVRLPDGSLVFLNAESSLKYPSRFAKTSKREVELVGEGYFSVSKDKLHPFVVSSKGQQVEVLGTEFNINAYPGERTMKTTLLEGSVKLTNAISRKSALLKPGEQSSVAGERLAVNQVEAEDAVAWKNGRMMYDGETLENIMKDAARWYDVQVIFKDGTIKNKVFFVSVSRSDNISKLLKILSKTKAITYEIKGNQINIDKNRMD